jgi:dipeptidyl aminopeptidase/acylaminoacyl peptidase
VIPEIVEDVRRSVRFIRFKAKEFGVDPERLGVLGASAGGHLTLVLATTGDDGDPNAKDEVLRQSSRVAAAVALYPPTDIRDWVSNPPEAIKKQPGLKPPLTFEPKKASDYSPVLHVATNTPPTLLIHGDKDELVPVEHSKSMIAALEKQKVKSRLLVIEGGEHGFTAKHNLTVVPAFVEWFEKNLSPTKGW